ncbi:MAG: archaeal proteasome endopeptidase complex subunit beta [Thermoplasmatales archaeon]|nr:archaeal proteasome endopeptidase complex subunit beta [Thermoplasmatales archaeon]
MAEDSLKTGTTTIGIKCKDGVVMASERRATMGHMIAHTNVQKVFRITDNIGMTIAGLVGDAQLMVRYAQAEASLYSMKRGAPMSVTAAATLVANIIRQGFYLGLIVGGHDGEGGHVFSIDGAGGCIEDDYVSVGSGSPFALGAMEGSYREGMSREEGIDLAITALNSAMRRDSASGNGMIITFIGPDGFESVPEDDIKARAAELGFKYPN